MIRNITSKRWSADVVVCRLVVVLLGLTAFLGCVPKPRMYEIEPGKLDWASIRNVVLLRFNGPEGETLRHHVYDRLNEVFYFNALDTTGYPALEQVTYDMVEEAECFHLTQELDADMLIGARATGAINDVRGTDQAEVKEGTGYFKKEKNLNGEWVDVEITRTVIRAVPYVIRNASLTTDYKVFDLNTGQIIATGTVTEKSNKKYGGAKPDVDLEYQPGEAPSPAASMDELSAWAATKLVAKISRMKVASTVEFDKGHNRLIRRGVVLARRGAWEDAMQHWQEAMDKEPTNAAAYYNLGIAHESLGDPEHLRTAKGLYKLAASYGDNLLYVEAIARVERMIEQGNK